MERNSQLTGVLREGIGVIQMVIFKELRDHFSQKYGDKDIRERAMLVGAIINKLFGMENPEPKFQEFNNKNRALIEQEMLGMAEQFPALRGSITDALRIQVLCDSQEGEDSSSVLTQAEELELLILDREVPLPSTFMTRVRRLGEQNGLTIAPVEITKEDDSLLH